MRVGVRVGVGVLIGVGVGVRLGVGLGVGVGVGKVRALAINSAKRAPQMPEIPTVAEAALPDYQYEAWFGVMVPAGTPDAIRTKVSQDIAAVLKMPDVIEQMNKVGNIPMPTTPAEFDKIIRNDTERYTKVMAAAGIVPK